MSTRSRHTYPWRTGHTVTLNRPDKRKALSLPLMLELTEALHDVGRSTAEVRLAGLTAAASC